MYIYFDESVHQECNFMLISFVLCSTNPAEDLIKILNKYELNEYHSCIKMSESENMRNLRSEYQSYIDENCSWGLLVLPNKSKCTIIDDLERAITSLKKYINISSISLDEDLIQKKYLEQIKESLNAEINIMSSHQEPGIQLADLVASFCGIQLKSEIIQNHKMLIYGKDYGFDQTIELPLSYELWASLRYSMLKNDVPDGSEMPEMATFRTAGISYFISEDCTSFVKKEADKLFSSVYLGCIR